ncbi:MAG: hypothetical protein JWR02_1431 [Mucilaginibacter sp.]|nr:hypothetical protein [Mucilaginibacter sp.]
MNLEQSIKIKFFQYGIILGVILLALAIFTYYLITRISISPIIFVAAPIFLSIFLPIIITVFLCYKGRTLIGGYWTFKQATTGIFIMFLVAYIIQFIGKDLVFYKFIEPNGIHNTQVAAINAKSTIEKQRGDNQKKIAYDISEMKKDFDLQQNNTIGNSIQGLIISILFIFVFALIFGALFKRDPSLIHPE